MKEIVDQKLDSLIQQLDNTPVIKQLVFLKQKIEQDNQILHKIEKLRILDMYSSEYQAIKKDLFKNIDFARFKELENEINYLILEINQILNQLVETRECHHEGN